MWFSTRIVQLIIIQQRKDPPLRLTCKSIRQDPFVSNIEQNKYVEKEHQDGHGMLCLQPELVAARGLFFPE